MKQDCITKMYAHLSGQEQARLSFQYAMEGNELEMARVFASVRRKDYSCPDVEYQLCVDGLTRFASAWAIEHWQTYCAKQTCLIQMRVLLDQGPIEQAKEMIDLHRFWESRLLAQDQVLQSICDEFSFSPDSVRRFAGAVPYMAQDSTVAVNSEYQVQSYERYAKMLQGWQAPK